MNALATWVAASWRRGLVVLGISVGLVCIGGGLDHWLFPRVAIHEVTHETIVTQVQWKTVVVTKEAEVKWKTRYVDRWVYGTNGEVSERTETREDSGERRETVVDERTEGASNETRIRDTRRDENPWPRWHAAVGLGVQPLRLGDFTAYVSLDYRIAGPFTLGGWAALPLGSLPSTTVGLSLGLVF